MKFLRVLACVLILLVFGCGADEPASDPSASTTNGTIDAEAPAGLEFHPRTRPPLPWAESMTLEAIGPNTVDLAALAPEESLAFDPRGRGSIEMPISEEVYRVIYEGRNAREALFELMGRPPRAELEY